MTGTAQIPNAVLLSAADARKMMPTFNPAATLARIEALITAAAKTGAEEVDVMAEMPQFAGSLSPSVINERRAFIVEALRAAGYAVRYYGGGYLGDASFTVTWYES